MRAAFSLVEHLVVITIMVILLAVLMPALDKAIYQAELTQCGANLHGIALGAQTYAVDHKRHYPYRPGMQTQWRPDRIYLANANTQRTNLRFDDRPILRGYMNINGLLNEPLAKRVDLESPQYRDPSRGPNVWAGYELWFGWRYAGEKGMTRLGDRFESKSESFSVLAGDQDLVAANVSSVTSSHPDDAGLLSNEVWQDGEYLGGGPGPDAAVLEVTNAVSAFTMSRWSLSNSLARGVLDLNYAYDDGSVRRFNTVRLDDEEMTTVPVFNDGREPTWEIQLPVPRG